jgi:TetR/AcrR family transcriptional regulator, tetracycline repressor protein
MKVNREIVIEAGLNLLNEVGLEQLTLRRLAKSLKIQAPTLYWHFKSKEELIDAMATLVLAKGAPGLVPKKSASDWKIWVNAFGMGLRQTLLKYRDGARVVAGSRLTDTVYMETAWSKPGFRFDRRLCCSAPYTHSPSASLLRSRLCFLWKANALLRMTFKSEMPN